MLNSFIEETCLRAEELEARLRDCESVTVDPDVLILLLSAAVGGGPVNDSQRDRLIDWAEMSIDSLGLRPMDYDTLRHLIGLRRPFGRGGSCPPASGRVHR